MTSVLEFLKTGRVELPSHLAPHPGQRTRRSFSTIGLPTTQVEPQQVQLRGRPQPHPKPKPTVQAKPQAKPKAKPYVKPAPPKTTAEHVRRNTPAAGSAPRVGAKTQPTAGSLQDVASIGKKRPRTQRQVSAVPGAAKPGTITRPASPQKKVDAKTDPIQSKLEKKQKIRSMVEESKRRGTGMTKTVAQGMIPGSKVTKRQARAATPAKLAPDAKVPQTVVAAAKARAPKPGEAPIKTEDSKLFGGRGVGFVAAIDKREYLKGKEIYNDVGSVALAGGLNSKFIKSPEEFNSYTSGILSPEEQKFMHTSLGNVKADEWLAQNKNNPLFKSINKKLGNETNRQTIMARRAQSDYTDHSNLIGKGFDNAPESIQQELVSIGYNRGMGYLNKKTKGYDKTNKELIRGFLENRDSMGLGKLVSSMQQDHKFEGIRTRRQEEGTNISASSWDGVLDTGTPNTPASTIPHMPKPGEALNVQMTPPPNNAPMQVAAIKGTSRTPTIAPLRPEQNDFMSRVMSMSGRSTWPVKFDPKASPSGSALTLNRMKIQKLINKFGLEELVRLVGTGPIQALHGKAQQ